MKKTTFLIVGKHAVIEALKNPSRKIERVFLTEDAKKSLNRENQTLNLLKNKNVFKIREAQLLATQKVFKKKNIPFRSFHLNHPL